MLFGSRGPFLDRIDPVSFESTFFIGSFCFCSTTFIFISSFIKIASDSLTWVLQYLLFYYLYKIEILFDMNKVVRGEGWVTNLLGKIPTELHLPGYNFCGPNTKLDQRLARGDKGINPLDEACKEHDKAYAETDDKERIREADKVLAEKAWQRAKDKSTPIGEKAAAALVTGAMKLKRKIGGGGARKTKKAASFSTVVREARKAVKGLKTKDLNHAAKVALKAAKTSLRKTKGVSKVARILPIPKRGGILPFLVPLFAGLSAVGGLAGGAAAITKAVNDASTARKTMEEQKRHNQKMESIALKGKAYGSGYYLRPYKNGYGLMTTKKN
jgi:Phospholipase A2-like domain